MSFAGVFRAQARACSDLGSPFTARVLNIIAENLTPGLPVFDRILAWEATPRLPDNPCRCVWSVACMRWF